MQILEKRGTDSAVLKVWSVIQKSNNTGIRLSDLYSMLSNELNKNEIDEALSYLNKLYLISYEKDSSANSVLLKKGEILGGVFEHIPCLGCEHLHECHVGGERFSPENCDEMHEWLEDVEQYLYGKNI